MQRSSNVSSCLQQSVADVSSRQHNRDSASKLRTHCQKLSEVNVKANNCSDRKKLHSEMPRYQCNLTERRSGGAAARRRSGAVGASPASCAPRRIKRRETRGDSPARREGSAAPGPARPRSGRRRRTSSAEEASRWHRYSVPSGSSSGPAIALLNRYDNTVMSLSIEHFALTLSKRKMESCKCY